MKRPLPVSLLLAVVLTILVLGVARSNAQPTGSKTPEFVLPITYQDQQLTQHVAFGYDPAATTSIDTAFGEEVYPNFGGPGSGVVYFDYPGVIDYGTRVSIMPKPAADSFHIFYGLHIYGSIYPGKVTWDPSLIPANVTAIYVTPLGNPTKLLVDMKQSSSADIVTTDFEYHDWENAVVTVFYNETPRLLGVHQGPQVAGLLSNISAYPNPFDLSGKLSFDLGAAASITIAAYDLTGREVGTSSFTFAEGTQTVDLERIIPSRGTYLLRVSANSARGGEEHTLLVRRR